MMKKKYLNPRIDTTELILAAGICSPVYTGGTDPGQSGGGVSGGGGGNP